MFGIDPSSIPRVLADLRAVVVSTLLGVNDSSRGDILRTRGLEIDAERNQADDPTDHRGDEQEPLRRERADILRRPRTS